MMHTILLVEDDPLLIDIYTTRLREAGFDVQVAKDGQAALSAIEEKPPELVLLDIVLPRVDGWEVLSKLKKEPKWQNIKVVVLSNLGQKEEIEKGRALGADLYLIKAHYTPTQVVEELQKLFLWQKP